MKIVKVSWYDSCTLHGWQHKDTDHKPALCMTVGYLARKRKDYISIAQSISNHDGVADLISIPRKSVQSMIFLKE